MKLEWWEATTPEGGIGHMRVRGHCVQGRLIDVESCRPDGLIAWRQLTEAEEAAYRLGAIPQWSFFGKGDRTRRICWIAQRRITKA